MWDYEKVSMVTYPFYFVNWQSIHKTNCMQSIKKISMWEVLPAIALKQFWMRALWDTFVWNYFDYMTAFQEEMSFLKKVYTDNVHWTKLTFELKIEN